jgi:anti-sigma regulatory factor (Ser/Thr protein kinase)
VINPPHPPPHSANAIDDVRRAVVVWSAHLHRVTQLADARREAAVALCQAGCGDQTVADVTLAMSELTTNAFTHGLAPVVELSVAVTAAPELVVLTTRHTDHHEPQFADSPTMAPPDELRGRGRAIAAAVASALDTIQHPGNRIEQIARFASSRT